MLIILFLISESWDQLQLLKMKVKKVEMLYGLYININTVVCMVFNKQITNISNSVKINGANLRIVNTFNHLGSMIHRNIRKRVRLARTGFIKLKTFIYMKIFEWKQKKG